MAQAAAAGKKQEVRARTCALHPPAPTKYTASTASAPHPQATGSGGGAGGAGGASQLVRVRRSPCAMLRGPDHTCAGSGRTRARRYCRVPWGSVGTLGYC